MKHVFLRQLPLFSKLDNEAIAIIADSIEQHTYKKNTTIFHEDAAANRLYIVMAGQLKLFKSSADGKDHILKIMQKHELIGEVPMYEGGNYPATCVTLTPVTLLEISRTHFLELLQHNPTIALRMLALQARRIKEFTNKIEKLTLNKTAQRLADFLLQRTNDHATVIMDDLSMQNLADYLGVSRENLSRLISNWSQQKLISKQQGKITILDSTRLRSIAA